jgi:hypothetical protein
LVQYAGRRENAKLTTTEGTSAGFADITSLLWREREALQLLLFKLLEEQLILQSGQTRWLARANQEIEVAVAQLRGADLSRAVEAEAVAGQLGLPFSPSLAELTNAAPEPWATMFADHRDALLKLTQELDRITNDNHALLLAAQRTIHKPVLSTTRTVETYAAPDARCPQAPSTITIDEHT